MLAGLTIYTLRTRAGNPRLLVLMGIGLVLGAVYTVRGSVPHWLVRVSGANLTDDDDPRNLSPKIYLPVLLGVIVLAAVLYHHYAGRGRP